MRRAASRAAWTAGNNSATKMPMIVIDHQQFDERKSPRPRFAMGNVDMTVMCATQPVDAAPLCAA